MAVIWRRACRRMKKLSLRSVTAILVMLVVFTNEFLVYWIQSWRWAPLPELIRNPQEELVVLFASDPQLIGYQDETGFPVGPITRWDSDRYMSKTFSLAHSYVQPDVVVFLGDLFDEGSKAFSYEYEWYISRFQSIFYPSHASKVVYIPGDNDVGGEGLDFRTKFKMSRFESNFENLTGVVNAFFIDFIKLDFRSQTDSIAEKKEAFKNMAHRLKAPVRIIVNHESVMASQLKMLVYPLLKLAQPNIIFTGHWHEAFHYVCETCLSSNTNSDHWPVHLRDLRKLQGWTEVDFTNLISLNELMVPTCSYRMGTGTIGYGIAVIRKSGTMKYTILWLPHRYTQLFGYLFALGFIVIMNISYLLISAFCGDKTHRR